MTLQAQNGSQSTETVRRCDIVKVKKTKPVNGATGSGDITKYLNAE